VACRCLLAWLLVLGCTRGADAAVAVLVTVRTVDATDPAPYELRLRSELATEAIDAIVANPNSAGGDARQLAARLGANAAVEVTVSTSEVAALIWAADPTLSLEVTRSLRVSNQQRDAVAVFALRAVDFLQGARLELEQQRRAKAASASTAAPAEGSSSDRVGGLGPSVVTPAKTNAEEAVRPAPAKSTAISLGSRVVPPRTRQRSEAEPRNTALRDRFRLDLGLALLVPFDGFGWSTAPAISLSWHSKSHWAVGATFAGPFVNHIGASSGEYRVTVDQEFMRLEFGNCMSLGRALDFEPYLGMGGSRYAASGDAQPPLRADRAVAWSLFTGAGVSVAWHPGSHLRLVGDLAGFGRWQAPLVQVGGNNLTGSSRWNLLFKLGLGWSF
jgi:hypothetical protein